jgi:predicted secreted protein
LTPDERIARPSVWEALELGSAVDECLREGPAVRPESAQGGLDAVSRFFGAKVINDGAGMIQLDVSRIATREKDLAVSVQVNWPLILTKAVARLYLIADGNRDPLLASISLIPDMVPPHVCVNVRLDDSTDVRAVVECGDGTLLQVRRWVWVMPPDLERNP